MSSQSRLVKVLLALIVSMTSGAVVLIALGNNAPSAGPFSLSVYRQLDPVENAMASQAPQQPTRWNSIEIFYSGTKAGNIAQLASLEGLARSEDINCHFCLCNGLGGGDGQLLATEKWQMQWSCVPTQAWYGSSQTIRVCVIADGKTTGATDCQRRRTIALVEALCRKFNISANAVYLPGNWQ
jgi:hypothetical protein